MPDPQTPCYFIAPDFLPSAGATHPVVDPATLEVVGRRSEVTDGEIGKTLSCVSTAQAAWKKLDAKSRRGLLVLHP